MHKMIVVAFTIQAHSSPIKTVGVLNLPEGPKLLTGSTDATVKVDVHKCNKIYIAELFSAQVWNLQTDVPTQDVAIPATGKVEHIEVSGSTIMWSVDEPLNKDQPDLTVGMVYLFNPNDMTSIAVKVCFSRQYYLGRISVDISCPVDLCSSAIGRSAVHTFLWAHSQLHAGSGGRGDIRDHSWRRREYSHVEAGRCDWKI